MGLKGSEVEQFPDFVKPLERGMVFNFACHKGLSCFTECCRLLELPLTSYDILRLRRATGLSSNQFLERYVIIEQEQDEAFPRLYLTMIDDGNGSCAFVASHGCTVYEHRPGACRAYPVGRAKRLQPETIDECFVLVKEDHCRGFTEPAPQTATQYCIDQGMTEYNMFNDALATLLQHEKVRCGFIPSQAQKELILLTLFHLDRWRAMLAQGEHEAISSETALAMGQRTDEELLLFAIKWLEERLFG
ncbi:MAG: YkgJ family cysteine cluster protein [Desulfoprunum sp.]|nr:YkgJ family cysteine cluster protein [Desulfoprunum sp.]